MSATASTNLRASPATQRGLGLIELMVAMLLGLLVAGSAVAIFASNRTSYQATESLGRIQENSRIAYEMMARDIREAGGMPCAHNIPISDVATAGTASGAWWSTWGGGLVGYDNGALPGSKAGSDALVMLESDDTPKSVVSHDPVNHKFTLNASPTAFKALDLVVVCDYRQGSMFQINAVTAGTTPPYTLTYAKSGFNCTTDLSMPANCSSTKNGIQYGNDAMVGRLRAVQWYVAANGRPNGYSLFQAQLTSDGTTSSVSPQEIVEGVTDMQLTYLLNGGTDYVTAATVGSNWSNVIAVRVALTFQGQDNGQGQALVSTTSGALTRTLDQLVSLRNHEQ